MPRLRSMVCCFAFLALLLSAPFAAAEETTTQRDARMQWWREAKFGMFIHWGVYAVPAGEYHGEQVPWIGEWIMRQAKIPVGEYRGYAKEFNPTKYDPQAWANLAEEAGMKYVVITSKHHDGFALYDSAVTDWDIADASPYGKDLLGPLGNAVRKQGMKFGLYYSQAQDWTHPGGAKMGAKEGEGWDAKHRGDYDQYLSQIAVPQTEEILTRFKPDVLWWDTPVWMNAERAKPLNQLLALQPSIITNNRLGGGFRGDTETPEQHIPATGFKGRDWETCMTMNDTWGYKSFDHNWKSTKTLVHNLVDIVSKGGNYLLNVGPTAEGEIPQASIDRLKEIGKWMDVNGQAIYATTASPCRRPSWGRITRKQDRLFLCVFDWPADGRLVVPVKVETTGCRLLANKNRQFNATTSDDGIVVHTTGAAPDAICSVIELGIRGEPVEVFQRVKPGKDGALALTAADAWMDGSVQVEEIGGQKSLGYWTNPADTVSWQVVFAKPGKYKITGEVAAPGESRLRFSLQGNEASKEIKPTGSYHRFTTQDLGRVTVGEAGEATITLRPDPKGWNAINLRRLALRPVE